MIEIASGPIRHEDISLDGETLGIWFGMSTIVVPNPDPYSHSALLDIYRVDEQEAKKFLEVWGVPVPGWKSG